MAHILLAEDNLSMSNLISSSLRKAGHKVNVIQDGIHALAELQDEECDYDLMLTDVAMPGIDGVELARRATTLRPDMQVMFITGFAAVALSKPAPKAANVPVSKRELSRPVHLRELAQNIDRLLAA